MEIMLSPRGRHLDSLSAEIKPLLETLECTRKLKHQSLMPRPNSIYQLTLALSSI
jgi:hypothetical protein